MRTHDHGCKLILLNLIYRSVVLTFVRQITAILKAPWDFIDLFTGYFHVELISLGSYRT